MAASAEGQTRRRLGRLQVSRVHRHGLTAAGGQGEQVEAMTEANGGRGGWAIKSCGPRLAKNKPAWLVLIRAPNDRTRTRRKGKEARLGQERRCGGEEEGMNEEMEEEGCDRTRWGVERRKRSVRNAH
jgi:hypothetical protein